MIAARQRSSALALALLLWGGLSCDHVTAPPTTGGIRIVLVSETTASLTASQAQESNASSDVFPIDAPTANVLLDAVRVTVTGPTTQTQTVSASTGEFFNVTITGLPPGAYTVTVEGLAGGQVAHYGQTSATVVAGSDSDANVTFTLFQPPVPNPTAVDTVEVLRFTVSWTAVTSATSYMVDFSTSPTLASATSVAASATSTEVVVPAEGQYFFAVRAVNAAVPSAGMRSAIKSAVVFHTVGNVNVLPAAPSIVDGTTQQFTAVARDLDNTVMTNVTLFWSSSNHAVATVNQSGLVTSVGQGQATITAIAKGRPGNAALTVTPQGANKLVFTAPPTNTTAGQSIAAIKVAVQNPKNEIAASDNTTQVTLQIAANPGSGALGGTATATAVDGVATFDNLSINKSGAGYTLQATATSLASATSSQFNITAGPATQLAFAVQPTTTTAGEAFSPALQVEFRDAQGNRVTSARDAITISIDNDPLGGTLSGTTAVSAIDGIASFSGLSLDKAAPGYTLRATAGGPIQVTSTAFTINPATPVGLAFSTQPVSVTSDNNIIVAVRARDRFDNLVNVDASVTISIADNPEGGTLTGTTTQAPSGGVASFADLKIDSAATGYTLRAESGTLTSALSSVFNVSEGVAAKLAFVDDPPDVEPSTPLNPIEVRILDAAGNQVPVAVNVALAIGVNPGAGTLSGVLTSASVGGLATFNSVAIDSTGVGYTLDATSGGLTTAHSDAFDVVLEFTQVKTGDSHTCGLTTIGSAYCWGWNVQGQLGVGTQADVRVRPTRVSTNEKFWTLTTGWLHSCGLRVSDSTAFCWGRNFEGELGTGSIATTIHNTPQTVTGGHKFIAITAGFLHTCAIRAADSLAFCWGEQSVGRLGNNQTGAAQISTPTQVNSVDRFRSISAGFEHSCAVRADGVGHCWGQQFNGRLGNDQVIAAQIGNPTAINGTWLEISAGHLHSCGIAGPETDRRGFCWGSNGSSQLGGFVGAETGTATQVANSLKYSVMQAGGRATNSFTCALTTAGTPFCWGQALEGRLGNGVNTGTFGSPQPVLTGGLVFLSIDAATAGNSFGGHACAMTTTGAYCWGTNFSAASVNGMLGDGTTASSSVPVKVKGQR